MLETNHCEILLIGAGQLGSRYLQGLCKCNTPLSISVVDISPQSLTQAERRWVEVDGPQSAHKVSFLTELALSPQHIDLAIVSTTAHIRPDVVKNVLYHAKVKYWLLEKVLAQSIEELNEIQFAIGPACNAWVNTPRRIILWHQQIKNSLSLNSSLHLCVNGGPWGLACNAVHFLDLMSWFSGEELIAVCTDMLDKSWVEAKRPGNWEIHGSLTALFSKGSSVLLSSTKDGKPQFTYDIQDESNSWHINEEMGTAVCSNGLKISGKLPYQSEMTAAIIDEILLEGNCNLPGLVASTRMHHVFIEALLIHWQKNKAPDATFVPIT